MNQLKYSFDRTFKIELQPEGVHDFVEKLGTKNLVLVYSKNGSQIMENDVVADVIFFGSGNYVFFDQHAGLINIVDGKIKSIEKAKGSYPENTMIKIYTDINKIADL